jgi:DNA-binding XRE family transcriptional regulator
MCTKVNFILFKGNYSLHKGKNMSPAINLPIPAIKALKKVGKDIGVARRKRRITMELMAERAGISRVTLGKIEKGAPTVSMGAYATVLFALGMIGHLQNLVDASTDIVGRELEEESLPKRVRLPQSRKGSE